MDALAIFSVGFGDFSPCFGCFCALAFRSWFFLRVYWSVGKRLISLGVLPSFTLGVVGPRIWCSWILINVYVKDLIFSGREAKFPGFSAAPFTFRLLFPLFSSFVGHTFCPSVLPSDFSHLFLVLLFAVAWLSSLYAFDDLSAVLLALIHAYLLSYLGFLIEHPSIPKAVCFGGASVSFVMGWSVLVVCNFSCFFAFILILLIDSGTFWYSYAHSFLLL